MDYKWYTIATYSGSEVKVSEEINKMAAADSNIKEAFVPMKKVFEIRKNKKVEVDQKVFQNYIFVNMASDLDTINKIRSIPRVIGFLGKAAKPESVEPEKIDKMKREAAQGIAAEEEKFEIGDAVRIREGHFESFNGIVEGKDESKNVLKIAISIFGRSTIIDIDSSKVEKAQ
jgi:transcriptional antiterminator NusG